MDWDTFLANLPSDEDRKSAQELVWEFGQGAIDSYLLYHLARSVEELENGLRKTRDRIQTQVQGLYESIDTQHEPTGWTITNRAAQESNGTGWIQTDIIGPNRAQGYFERGYNREAQRVEMRNAFLILPGADAAVPTWISGMDVPMVPSNDGTPTVQYF